MYVGGDYLGAVVADIGSHSTRIGFAGEDFPRYYAPTLVAIPPSQDEKNSKNYSFDMLRYTPGTILEAPVTDGIITDWDWLERVWEHSFSNFLKVDMKDTPVMMAEKIYNTSKDRQRMCELMFETNNAPAFFLSKDVVLTTFATGRTGGLVVDCGGSGTVITPVQDGWADIKGFNRSIVGGRYLDAYLFQILRKQGVNPRPLYRINKTVTDDAIVAMDKDIGGPISPSYDAWACLEIARELKESVCRASDVQVIEGDVRYTNIPLIPYELPDGTHLDVGGERFQPAEAFFDPSVIELSDPMITAIGMNVLYPMPNGVNRVMSSVETLPRLVVDSILRSENVDGQAGLCGNIIVAGGSSSLDGLSERLRAEVESIVFSSAPSWKVRTMTTGAGERPLCAWLGGSILASLGTFHETWLARSEYNEFGAHIVDRKCP